MQPKTRRERLIAFNNRIQESEQAARIRTQFGLEIDRELVQVNAHVIDGARLIFTSPLNQTEDVLQ